MKHANDNQPRSPAEHRAFVEAQRASQDATREVRNRSQSRPTLARLKRADAWREIQALERFAEDEGISAPEGMLHAANDNAPVDDAGRAEISRVDSRLDEENPTAEEMAAAAWADEKDRKEGRPELANRIQFDAKGRIVAVKVRGRYRSLVEAFSEPRGPAADNNPRVSMGAGYSMPDELPDAQDDAARRIDHMAMKRRLGREVCRVLELALGDLTAEEIGTELGLKDKTAERMAVRLIDGAIVKLIAAYAARDAADREAA
ncbi:hypothetical protein [Bradyrhizobium cenepequi]|uniref:hypothetical protein n=1 Tax=Bradyrhizobium cenepequi TaxID=2821403 RepID=UPI001CE33D76|nr:hypothetical protein [Bradyrhizobium cenepequi]MCA6109603.1 hypothetical protein [Bradyrhizobium cenepequi]